MSGDKESRRGLTRLLLFEGLALAGLVHLLLYAPAGNRHTYLFLYNAVAFLLLYPAVYLFKWLPLPGLFRFLLLPLNILLHALLMVSTFLWIGYAVFARFSFAFPVYFSNFFILWLFWAMLYLAWFRYVLGVSRRYMSLGPLLGFTMIVAAGGVAGFFVGQWVVGRWGLHIGSPSTQFLTWVLLALIGMSGAAFLAPKRTAETDE